MKFVELKMLNGRWINPDRVVTVYEDPECYHPAEEDKRPGVRVILAGAEPFVVFPRPMESVRDLSKAIVSAIRHP